MFKFTDVKGMYEGFDVIIMSLYTYVIIIFILNRQIIDLCTVNMAMVNN